MINNFFKKLKILKRKLKSEKKSYSFGGVDLLVNYIFKNKRKGIYLDVGSQHPISNNNTYLLYKRGWHGINIDLDSKNIDLFNIARKGDININVAISSSESIKKLYFYHPGSPINTISKNNADRQKAKIKEIREIKTNTLNNILEQNDYNKIDYLNIDVEGHELDVLKGLDLTKYEPDVISVEFLDLKMKKLEFKNNNIKDIIDSDLYKHMINNNYSFINWNHADLIFVNNKLRD